MKRFMRAPRPPESAGEAKYFQQIGLRYRGGRLRKLTRRREREMVARRAE
jgi:hypothetical protein